MRQTFPASRWLVRVASGVLFLTMTAIGIWPSCDSSEVPVAIDVGTGGTHGAEISLSVLGRGRVTTTPPAIDCPSNCFARIVLPSASVDGGDGGITLIAQDSPRSHFVGWSFAEVDLGARGRGPPECSPMTRKASLPPSDNDLSSTVVSVPFGETQGTPPPGHEAECAAFRSVSLAYAVTAKFEDDPAAPGFDAEPPDPADQEVLFLPTDPSSQAKEIGVTGSAAYWRFEVNGLSGVAGSSLPSNAFSVIVSPDQQIRLFDVDRHAVFQYADGELWVITAGQMTTIPLGAAPFCLALASDAENVYCRADLDGGSAIYAWPLAGGDTSTPSIVHVLPPGNDLGVDTQRFYFSEDHGVFGGPARMLSVTRNPDVDGGTSAFTTLVTGQTSPLGVSVGPTSLAWIDDLRNGTYAVRSASKLTPSLPVTGFTAPTIRFVAADPVADEYWFGVVDGAGGGFQIYRAPNGASQAPTVFRSGTTDLGGLAVDGAYVYWTRSNGRVYRALKNNDRP